MITAPILLSRVDAGRNMARYYFLALQPGLFEEWAVLREWGRIGSPGQMRTSWHQTETAAATQQAKLARAKLRRGYRWAGETRISVAPGNG